MKFCNTPNGTRVAYTFNTSEVFENLRGVKPLVLLHGFCEDHAAHMALYECPEETAAILDSF